LPVGTGREPLGPYSLGGMTHDRRRGDKPDPGTDQRPVSSISAPVRVALEMGKQERDLHRRGKGVESMSRKIVGIIIVGLLLAPGAYAEGEAAQPDVAYGQVLACFEGFLAELNDAIQALNRADQDLVARYRTLAAELSEAKAAIGQLRESVAGLVPRIEGLEAGLADAAEAISNLHDLVADKFAEVQARFEANEAAIQGLVEDFTSFKAQVEGQLGALADRLAQCMASCDERFGALSAQLAELAESLATLSSQVRDHEARLAALEEQDLGSLQRRILALEQAAQALQIKIENNRAKLEGVEAALGGFTADIQANKEAIASLTRRLGAQETRLTALEAQVDGLDVQAVQDALGAAQGMAILALLVGIAAIVLVFMGTGG